MDLHRVDAVMRFCDDSNVEAVQLVGCVRVESDQGVIRANVDFLAHIGATVSFGAFDRFAGLFIRLLYTCVILRLQSVRFN